jgi:hypothetical protein
VLGLEDDDHAVGLRVAQDARLGERVVEVGHPRPGLRGARQSEQGQRCCYDKPSRLATSPTLPIQKPAALIR